MRTNDIFRQLVQALQLDTAAIQVLFAPADIELSEKEIANLLKTDYQPGFQAMPDYVLLAFLNNLIDAKRGKKEGAEPEPVARHQKLPNNDVLKKLRIAFNLHEQDVREVFKAATIELTKSDLSALFRKPGNTHFKGCDDELVLGFIEGLGKWLQQGPAHEA